MKKCIIDFGSVSDTVTLHQCIKDALELDDKYNNSLESLKNELSRAENCEIILKNIDILYSMDIIGVNILKVFEEAADTNDSIIVIIE